MIRKFNNYLILKNNSVMGYIIVCMFFLSIFTLIFPYTSWPKRILKEHEYGLQVGIAGILSSCKMLAFSENENKEVPIFQKQWQCQKIQQTITGT